MSIWDKNPSALQRAKELHAKPEPVSWYNNIAAVLNEEHHTDAFTYNSVRNKLRRDPLTEGMEKVKAVQEQPVSLKDNVLKAIQKEQYTSVLCEHFGVSERVLGATLEDLREEGYSIVQTDKTIQLCRDILAQENIYESKWNGEKILRFALLGDDQSGSKYTQRTLLHNFYDLLEAEGITDAYHTGDISEGEEMRLGHKYECYTQGADEIVEDITTHYPKRKGITTHFITGNHDHSLIKRAGYDIGVAIGREREDMKYLGMSSAVINLTHNCTLELRHPIDGTAYAKSYKIQKMVEAMQGGEKPNILAVGHYHKAEYFPYRNVHCFQTGTFQAQTPFMRGKGIAADVGGWIVEVHVDNEGSITRCKGEFIAYYKMIKDDWKNWR